MIEFELDGGGWALVNPDRVLYAKPVGGNTIGRFSLVFGTTVTVDAHGRPGLVEQAIAVVATKGELEKKLGAGLTSRPFISGVVAS